MKTDNELVYDVLKDLDWHHVQEICQRCKPGKVNFAARSRVSNLKVDYKMDIKSRIAGDGEAEYRLRTLPQFNPFVKPAKLSREESGQMTFLPKTQQARA